MGALKTMSPTNQPTDRNYGERRRDILCIYKIVSTKHSAFVLNEMICIVFGAIDDFLFVALFRLLWIFLFSPRIYNCLCILFVFHLLLFFDLSLTQSCSCRRELVVIFL